MSYFWTHLYMAKQIGGTFKACKTLGFSLTVLVSSGVFGKTKKQNIAAPTKTPPSAANGNVKPPASYNAPPTVGPENISKICQYGSINFMSEKPVC